MGRSLMILLLVMFTSICIAQKEDARYRERAKEIQKGIWQDTTAAFRVNQIPETFNNESAIVIAAYYKITNSSRAKFKANIGEVQRLNYELTFRQRVKINDKTALEKFSYLEYVKLLDQGFSFRFTKIQNKMATYIGVKIIKQSGAETIVDTEEEVLVNNENKNKEAKLAIPGLQVGDILDYYIKSEVLEETLNSIFGPVTFFINGNYPILYYAIHIKLDIESGVQYINANGAPSFTESTNEDGDIILDLRQTNIPKYTSSLLTSAYRQYPYIRLQCQRAVRGYDIYSDFARGQVKRGYRTREMVTKLIKRMDGVLNTQKYYPHVYTRDYFGGAEKMRQIPKDSIVKVLFNAWRYYWMTELLKSDEYSADDIKSSFAPSLGHAVYVSKMLTSLDIDNTIYLVCSRNAGSLENILNTADFDAVLKVKTDQNYWLAFNDIFTQFHEIPIRYQGEEAITLQPSRTGEVVNYTSNLGKIPITVPAYNSISEELLVSFDSADMGQLQITRNCRQTGASRHALQKQLLLTEDITESIESAILPKKKLEETLKPDRKSRLEAEYANQRNNIRAGFENEISNQFNTSPRKLASYAVLQPSLFSNSIPFEYKASFIIENYVKKAGSNYIVEVGKLAGDKKAIDETDHNPNLDIFLSCPMTQRWTIHINIPPGYEANGIEELNKSIDNETGSFSCIARKEGRLVNIEVSAMYAHNFEKAANWPKFHDIMDALNNFATQKILLEKKK